MNVWDLLGIAPTHDVRAIKRAYSVKLKTTRPDDDAQAYQQLREAYDWAQNFAKSHVAHGVVAVDEPAPQLPPEPTQTWAPAEPVASSAPPEPLESPPPAVSPSDGEQTPTVTVDGLVHDCKATWELLGSAALASVWPRKQALLEDLPIAEHNTASRAFAQFVVDEPDLPVEVLIALTRHFQWGLDFRVNQFLGPELSQGLHQRLSAAEVFAAFRPEASTQHDWALALAKLWDGKRRLLARLLAAGLDYPTRSRVLQARVSTLRALGASRAAAAATQSMVALGGMLQAGFFALLVSEALALLYEPGTSKKSFPDVVGLGLAAGIVFFLLYQGFRDNEGDLKKMRNGRHVDWIVFIPVLMAPLLYLDQHASWLAGYSNGTAFLVCLICLYLGLWLLAPTDEYPWRKLVLPTFFLLLFGLQEFSSEMPLPLLISLAFAWTLGAHVVLRRYPERVEAVYANLIKLGTLRASPWRWVLIKFIALAWALTAIAMLPVLLFRMAARYRGLYAGAAIYAGVLLANVRSMEGQTQGLILWVLAVVFCIQLLQSMAQGLANYGLKRLRR